MPPCESIEQGRRRRVQAAACGTRARRRGPTKASQSRDNAASAAQAALRPRAQWAPWWSQIQPVASPAGYAATPMKP
jgi:hypothetical protein